MNHVLLIGMIFAAAGAVCLIRVRWELRHLTVTRIEVSSAKLCRRMRFAVVADLHNAVFGKNGEELYRRIEAEHPEAILIPGDLVVGKKGKDTGPAEAFLAWAASRYPVFYSPGNHEMRAAADPEQYGAAVGRYIEEIKKRPGIRYLSNDTASYSGIRITGLDLGPEYYGKGNHTGSEACDVEAFVGKKEKAVFTILLAHNPEYLDAYADWGADLVLSGHNHGGIVRLPFLGGVISASLHLFHPLISGVHKRKDTTMIISRGLGTHTIPVRFLNTPEIVIVDLVKTESLWQ